MLCYLGNYARCVTAGVVRYAFQLSQIDDTAAAVVYGRLGETKGTVANLRSRNERLEREVADARAAAAAAARAPAAGGGGAAGGAAAGGGGLMAFAAQDLHRQLDAAQEQLVFKEQEVRLI